jgi:hypothetical protein
MTTPAGTITFADINIELCRSSTAQLDLNDSEVRVLASKPAGVISLNDLRGKSFPLTGPGGSYVSPLAQSSTGAGSGFRIRYLSGITLAVVRERAGDIDPGGFEIQTAFSTTAVPLNCVPNYSARVTYVSGDSSMLIQGASFDTWVALNSGDGNTQWGFFASIGTGGGFSSKVVIFNLQVAPTSNLSNILSSTQYAFSGSAESTGGGGGEIPD